MVYSVLVVAKVVPLGYCERSADKSCCRWRVKSGWLCDLGKVGGVKGSPHGLSLSGQKFKYGSTACKSRVQES